MSCWSKQGAMWMSSVTGLHWKALHTALSLFAAPPQTWFSSSLAGSVGRVQCLTKPHFAQLKKQEGWLVGCVLWGLPAVPSVGSKQ